MSPSDNLTRIEDLTQSQLDGLIGVSLGGVFTAWDQCLAIRWLDGSEILLSEPWSDDDEYYSPSTNDDQALQLVNDTKGTLVFKVSDDKWVATIGQVQVSNHSSALAISRAYVTMKYGTVINYNELVREADE